MKENKLKYARIGSVLNYNTRKMEPTKHAFDLSQLAAIGRIDTANPIGIKIVQSNAFAKSSQDSHSFGTANEFKLGFPKCKISIGAHREKGEAKLESESGLSLTVGSSYVDYEIFITKDVTEKELYNCATPLFKEKYEALAKAMDFATWQKAYTDFTKEFGHGFVSKMKLMSFSAGILTVHYDSSVESSEVKFGGSVSVSARSGNKTGGAATGNEWANMHSKAGAKGTVNAKSVSVPAGNSNAAWVDKFVETYSNQGIDIITKAPPASVPIPTVNPKAPEIPTVEKIKDPKALPEFTLELSSTEDMIKYMQMKEMMTEGGHTINTIPSWEDYQQSKKKNDNVEKEKEKIVQNAEALNQDKIAKDGVNNNAIKSNRSLSQMDFVNSAMDASDVSSNSSPEVIVSNNSSSEENYASNGSPINLSDYTVYDVEYTRYSDVLSGLQFQSANPTNTAYFIAKLTTFIMTRQLFASYLHFVSDIPLEITKGYITKNRAIIYADYLKRFTEELDGFISDTDIITEDHYNHWTASFTQGLLNENSFKLCFNVYKYFFENYKIFSSAPFGYMLYCKYKINNLDYLYYHKRSTINYDTFYSVIGPRSPYQSALKRWTGPEDWSAIAENSTCFFPIIIGTESPYIHLATYVIAPDQSPYWRVVGYTITVKDTLLSTDYFTNTIGVGTGKLGPGEATPCYLANTKLTEDFVLKKVSDNKIINNEIINDKDYTCAVDIYAKDDPDNTYLKVFSSLDTSHAHGTPPTAYFKPIDYDMVRNQKMQGVPMWHEFSFDEVKKSILMGFDQKIKH